MMTSSSVSPMDLALALRSSVQKRLRSFTRRDRMALADERPDQVKGEFIRVMEIIEIIFKALDFDNFEAQISLRDPNDHEKYVGGGYGRFPRRTAP